MRGHNKYWNSIMCTTGCAFIATGVVDFLGLDNSDTAILYTVIWLIALLNYWGARKRKSDTRICGVPIVKESRDNIDINYKVETIDKSDVSFMISEMNKWKSENNFTWYAEPDVTLAAYFTTPKKDSIKVVKYLEKDITNIPREYEGILRIDLKQEKDTKDSKESKMISGIFIDNVDIGDVKSGVIGDMQSLIGKHIRISILYGSIIDYEVLDGGSTDGERNG